MTDRARRAAPAGGAGVGWLCWRAIAGAFLLCFALRAWAAEACPGESAEPLPITPAELWALREQLAGLEPRCGRVASFAAYRGAVALALGRAAEAAEHLELALLLDPHLAVAQVDYARALTLLGDTASASALWRELLKRADLPPQLRSEIERRVAALTPAEPGHRWRWNGDVGLRAGYDTNLNSATSASELALTFPGGDLNLPLDPSSRAVAGAATWLDGRAQGLRRLGEDLQLEIRAEARLRGTNEPGLSYRQLDVDAAVHRYVAGGMYSVTLGAGDLFFGGADLQRIVRASALRSWFNSRCVARLGIEAELRRYDVNPILDGTFAGAVAGGQCVWPSWPWLGTALRWGVDRPNDPLRPGAERTRFDGRLQAQWQIGELGFLLTTVSWQREADRSGYSPILAGGARRWIERSGLAFEWSRPAPSLGPAWQLVAAAEGVYQRSNIALFELHGLTLQLGVRRGW